MFRDKKVDTMATDVLAPSVAGPYVAMIGGSISSIGKDFNHLYYFSF